MRGIKYMAKLKDIMVYIIEKYPFKSDLSNAKLTKMIYLADWKHAITYGGQISGINWYFDNYGPFVWDIKDEAENDSEFFLVKEVLNAYGSPKVVISLKDITYLPKLTKGEEDSIDHVIETTKKLNWDQFIRLVYSTYPIISSEKYTYLDLSKKAEEYLVCA
jgi:hypothetical protein